MKLLYLLPFLGFQLIAQDQEVTAYPMSESSLLWEIQGENVPKGSYLFGTMHLIEKDYFLFPKKLEKIVSKSEVLIMEIAGLPDQAEAMKYLMLEEGTFFDYFNDEQTDSILAWAKSEMKLSEEGFRSTFTKMKPFTVVQFATQMQFIGKTESYEVSFEKLAKEYGLSIEGLETIAEQMAIFDSLSNEQISAMVMESIRKSDETIELTRNMMAMYSRQQIDSLYMMIEDEGGVLADEQQEFLDNRNAKWIPKIKDAIREKKTFIAVGAGHLGGPNGVIRLLEKEGYTLIPVKL